ncbi:MAG: hypothetical protein WD972_00815 [Candidatus Andersenbacteria bacterium]
MKAKPKRTDKVLMGIFIGAVVVAVLIVAVVVFDPTGLLRAARPPRTPAPPRTPGVTECLLIYDRTLPAIPSNSKDCNFTQYDKCLVEVTLNEENCRRKVPVGVKDREARMNQCALVAATDLKSKCTLRYCRAYTYTAEELIRCVEKLPLPEPKPTKEPATSPKS